MASEHSREVSMREAHGRGDLTDGEAAIMQERTRQEKALLGCVLVRWAAGRFPKRPREMVEAHPSGGRDIRQRYIPCEVGVDELLGAPQPAGRHAVCALAWKSTKAGVGSQKVRREFLRQCVHPQPVYRLGWAIAESS